MPDHSSGGLEVTVNGPTNTHTIQDDLRSADLVIGTHSACAIDACLLQRDYILYDESAVPFSETLNYSFFNDASTVQVASSKEQLFECMRSYKPSNGNRLLEKINPYERLPETEEILDLRNIFQDS